MIDNLKKTLRRPKIRFSAIHYAFLLRYLIDNPGQTRQELADASGISYTTLVSFVREFRKNKLIYRSGMSEDCRGARTIEEFSFGINKRDFEPKPIPSAERSQRWKAKLRRLNQDRRMLGLSVSRSTQPVEELL